jgi:hypothetical protein
LSPCYFWAHALALRAPGSWRAQRAAALWNENMPSKKSCKEVCGAAGMPLGVLGAPKPPALPAVGGGADAMSAGVSDEACRSQAFGIFGGLPGAAAMDTASPRSGQAPGVLWEGAANTTPEHEARDVTWANPLAGVAWQLRDWHSRTSVRPAAEFDFPISYSHTPASPPASALCRNSRHLRRDLQS